MLTTFQIVLAIVGVALIAAIIIYNLMQERRFRKEAEKMFSHKREDVMLGEAVHNDPSNRRSETQIHLTDNTAPEPEVKHVVDEAEAPLPSMDAMRRPQHGSILSSLEPIKEEPFPAAPVRATAPVTSRAAAPAAKPAVPAAAAPAVAVAPAVATSQGSGLDGMTEYIARLKLVAPAMLNFGPLLATLRRIGKPVRGFGHRADGSWEALSGHPRSAFDLVEFGLQLADRSGALSQDQLDVFSRALYEFAAEEGGAVTCPDKQEALAQARDLDLFCMDVDVLIGLNVVSADSRPFTSEAMHGLALEAKLSLEADGTFHARDEFGHTLFTLANQGDEPFPRDGRGLTTHGVTLLFDVPRVADGLAVFDRMTQLGFDLAQRLEGRLVDDNSRPVSEESLNMDRSRLAVYYQRMQARAVPAGGERSLRLFL